MGVSFTVGNKSYRVSEEDAHTLAQHLRKLQEDPLAGRIAEAARSKRLHAYDLTPKEQLAVFTAIDRVWLNDQAQISDLPTSVEDLRYALHAELNH